MFTLSEVEYDLQAPGLFMNPRPMLHRMRRDAPVYFSPQLDSWLLTRYEDVTAELRDPKLSVVEETKRIDELPEDERGNLDPLRRIFLQFHDQTAAYGYTRVKVFAQHEPQEMIVIYLEADDVRRAMVNQAQSDDEFENRFRGTVKELAGFDPGKLAAGPPSELLHDWHAERGNARTHHGV